jgi:hypothetical protein
MQSFEEKKIPEKITSIAELFDTLPPDIDLDSIRSERLGCDPSALEKLKP